MDNPGEYSAEYSAWIYKYNMYAYFQLNTLWVHVQYVMYVRT